VTQPVMFFNGRNWESSDHRWAWDGYTWRSSTPPKLSRGIRLSRGAVVIQAVTTAIAGAFALLLALMTAASGREWLLFGLAVFALACALAGLAWFLFWLRSKMGHPTARWRVGALVTEILLFPAGVALAWAAEYANEHAGTPQNPGTDGPFADGGAGAIGLMGYAYVIGALVVICAVGWERIRRGSQPALQEGDGSGGSPALPGTP
jgi:hypothetical protein